MYSFGCLLLCCDYSIASPFMASKEVWVSFEVTIESCVIVHSWWFIWDWQNNKRSAKAVGCSSFESFIQQGTHEDFVQRKDELQMLWKMKFPTLVLKHIIKHTRNTRNVMNKHSAHWRLRWVWCKLPGRQEESKTLHNQPTRDEEIVTLLLHKSNKQIPQLA